MVMPGVTTRKRVGEALVVGVGQLVEGLPGDEHRHDDRLARPVAILKASLGRPWFSRAFSDAMTLSALVSPVRAAASVR